MLHATRRAIAATAAIGALTAIAPALTPAFAQEGIALPRQMVWTAYDTGSSGFNHAVAIGKALKEKLGVNLRVLPGKNDISRTVPLREGKVQMSATGLASFFGQEGVFEFAAPDWGPQPTRVVMMAIADSNLAVGTAADAGIKTLKDLKGKRMVVVKGAPALNYNIESMLTCAGLSVDDVVPIEVAGYAAGWGAINDGQADFAWATTTSGQAVEVANGPRGLFWPPVPHDDKACWDALARVAPYMVPHTATLGANISPDNPHEGAAYPYPILTVYADQDEALVYNTAKALVELFDDYKDGAPAADGWALDRQAFQWSVPFHRGAVKLFKEKGVWTDEMQAHTDKLIERQTVLKTAWDAYSANPAGEGDAFVTGWMAARAEALTANGFDVIWEE